MDPKASKVTGNDRTLVEDVRKTLDGIQSTTDFVKANVLGDKGFLP